MGRQGLPIKLSVHLIAFLLAELIDHKDGGPHCQHPADCEHPCPVGAGLGKLKTLGVHNGKGNRRMDGASVRQHLNALVVDRGGGGQHRAAAVGTGLARLSGELYLDAASKQVVVLIRRGLRGRVLVVLEPPDDDLSHGGGYKLRRLRLLGGAARHIVDAVDLPCLHIVVVRIIVQEEADILNLPRTVGELLRQHEAVAVNMGVVPEGVGTLGVASAPCEGDGVRVAAIAAEQACVRTQGAGIRDAHGAVGVAPVQALRAVDALSGVDLRFKVIRATKKLMQSMSE